MKKFAIMFVMLLGSVATMQAQSFSFNCGGFSTEEVADLYEAEFEANGGIFQHATPNADVNTYANITRLVLRNGDIEFEVGDDVSVYTKSFASLDDAIAFAIIPNFYELYLTPSVVGFELSQTQSLLDDGFVLDSSSSDTATILVLEGMIILPSPFGTTNADAWVKYDSEGISEGRSTPGTRNYWDYQLEYGTESARYYLYSNDLAEIIERVGVILP